MNLIVIMLVLEIFVFLDIQMLLLINDKVVLMIMQIIFVNILVSRRLNIIKVFLCRLYKYKDVRLNVNENINIKKVVDLCFLIENVYRICGIYKC